MGDEPKLRPHWKPYHDRMPTSPWALAQMVLTGLFFVMFLLGLLLTDRLAWLRSWGIALCILGPIFLVLSHFERRRRRTSEAELASRRFLVCPECLYDLRKVLSQPACPECGTSFDVTTLPMVWRLIDERSESERDNN